MALGHYQALFVDIGGVFLTNGWDRHARERAIQKFGLDAEETNKRHSLTFDTYEIGKISLDEYLKRVVFYQPRSFTIDEFKTFMFEQSQPFPEMIDLICQFKSQYSLQTTVISNEGKELTDYRVKMFKLKEFIDVFVFSYSVHMRKPDFGIYQVALDVTRFQPQDIIYIDDRPMLVEIANQLGMTGIHHTHVEATQMALSEIAHRLTGTRF